jgi:hypothetical protein
MMNNEIECQYFEEENRSERALQARILVPALNDPEIRYHLISRINLPENSSEITRAESDSAIIWHFVWVLSPSFLVILRR